MSFDMKNFGGAKKNFGIKIYMDKNARKLRFSEKSYVENVLYKFDISNLKVVSNPLRNQFKLSLDQCPKD